MSKKRRVSEDDEEATQQGMVGDSIPGGGTTGSEQNSEDECDNEDNNENEDKEAANITESEVTEEVEDVDGDNGFRDLMHAGVDGTSNGANGAGGNEGTGALVHVGVGCIESFFKKKGNGAGIKKTNLSVEKRIEVGKEMERLKTEEAQDRYLLTVNVKRKRAEYKKKTIENYKVR
jgi:hypothetical protein